MAAHNIPTDFKKLLPPTQLSGLPQHSKYEDLKLGRNFQNPKPKTDPG